MYDFSKADHEKIYILASRLASELSEELGCQRCSRQLNAANTRLSAAIVKNDASALQSAISQSETSFNSTQRLKEMTAFRDQHIARHILIRVSEVDKASIPIFIIGAAHFTKKTGIVDQLIFRGAYACEGG